MGDFVSHNSIRPHPDWLKSLLTLPVSNELASLNKGLGSFAYYSKWTHKFSDRIKEFNKSYDSISWEDGSESQVASKQIFPADVPNNMISEKQVLKVKTISIKFRTYWP